MKFNLPKFEVPKVPAMNFGRGEARTASASQSGADAAGAAEQGPSPSPSTSAPAPAPAQPGFGAKSKEQMSNFLRKTRRTLTPRSRPRQQPPEKQQSEPPPGTELQKSSSDPHVVANLKGILKGRKNKNKSGTPVSTTSGPEEDEDAAMMSASTSELGGYTRGDSIRQGDLKSMESGSRSTMGMAREHSQSSVIEKIRADGSESLNRPPRPPPPKRFQRHKAKKNAAGPSAASAGNAAFISSEHAETAMDAQDHSEDDGSPPRPSRRKEPVGQRHLRVNRDIPYIEEGAPEVESDDCFDQYPCPFIFETHETFGDTEAFVEMLTQNILKDSWEDYKGQVAPTGSASAPTTMRRLPKSTQHEVGASLLKALELQVEIENKLKQDRDAREQRLKEIEQWQNELKNIKLPDFREIKQQLASRGPAATDGNQVSGKLRSSPYYPSMTHSLDRGSALLRHAAEEFHTPPESPSLSSRKVLNLPPVIATPRTKKRQLPQLPPPVPNKRSATLPRHIRQDLPVSRPKAPERKKKQGSRFSLPDYKIGGMDVITTASETESGLKQMGRPLPPPPTPPKTRNASGYASLPAPRSVVQQQQQQQIQHTVRVEDVPPEVIRAIIEISKSVLLGASGATPQVTSNRTQTEKELGDGLSVPELKVKKLSIEELSAVRIIVNNLAAKHTVADKATFGHIYTKNPAISEEAAAPNNSQGGHVSTEDISKTEDATATFESAPCETTTESSTSQNPFDTDLDCDSDLEGSIKSVEIAFDAIEETLQTFKETIESGPNPPASGLSSPKAASPSRGSKSPVDPAGPAAAAATTTSGNLSS